jgi:hypothetical protein
MPAGFSSGSVPLATAFALKPEASTFAGVPGGADGFADGTPVVIWATAAAAAASPATPTAAPGTILLLVGGEQAWPTYGRAHPSW